MASRGRLTPQVLFGLFVIVVGVLFTLDNLNVLDARQYLQYWPAALVAIGALKLWQRRGWIGGLVLVTIGSWMLVEHLTYIRIDARIFWPLVLVFVGGSLVWRGLGGSRRRIDVDGNKYFSAMAVMAGISRGSNATDFEGADLTAVMGGCEIDLRQASIAPGTEAVIDCFAFWGGIEIRVPEDWTVVARLTPIMGGIEDQTRPSQGAGNKRLQIRGVAIMGGVVVKN